MPRANLPNTDPLTSTACTARDHAFPIYHRLYGMGEKFRQQPRMGLGPWGEARKGLPLFRNLPRA